MPPASNIVGAAFVAAMGYYVSGHMALTPLGGSALRLTAGLAALLILAMPYLR